MWSEIAIEVIKWAAAAAAPVVLIGIATWVKNLDITKKLGVEQQVDQAFEWIIHYVQGVTKKTDIKGIAKMKLAKDAAVKELKRLGIKLDPETVERRLEGVLNKLQPEFTLDLDEDPLGMIGDDPE